MEFYQIAKSTTITALGNDLTSHYKKKGIKFSKKEHMEEVWINISLFMFTVHQFLNIYMPIFKIKFLLKWRLLWNQKQCFPNY